MEKNKIFYGILIFAILITPVALNQAIFAEEDRTTVAGTDKISDKIEVKSLDKIQTLVNSNPLKIGKVGSMRQNMEDALTGAGNTVVSVDINSPISSDIDTLWLPRAYAGISGTQLQNVKDYLANGGRVITEFSSTTLWFNGKLSSLDGTLVDSFYTPSFSVSGGNLVTVENSTSPFTVGLPDTWISGDPIGVWYVYDGLNPNQLSFPLKVEATTKGDLPVVSCTTVAGGNGVMFFTDFADFTSAAKSEEYQLLLNAFSVNCDGVVEPPQEPQPEPTRVCNSYNFDGEVVPEEFSGVTDTESVAGYTAEGFSGNYLRNHSAYPPQKTTLTLTNLPTHNFVDIGFLLAIIDSWDGEGEGQYSPDIMNVDVDGKSIFSEGFVGAGGVQSYVPSDGVLLLGINEQQNRAVSHWADSAYNMTNESVFRGIPHTSDSLTIDWYASGSGWQGGDDESWAIDNVEVCTDTLVAPQPEIKHRGSDNQWATRPTFGISNEDLETQLVDSGFSFNGQSFTITDNHHTPFEEQSVDIGTQNTFSAKVYADKGLKVQEFLFGIPSVGESQLAELGVEVWYDIDGSINDVKVVQKSEVIDPDTVSVTHEKSKCLPTDPEPICDTTSVSMTFMEPLKDKVMAIKAIDWKNRDQRTYLNKGFDISGESLNPMLTKMIPANQKNQGLIQVTQLAKYSPYWQSSDGRMFEMNDFGSFKEINQTFERFQDSGDAKTRLHSGFGGLVENEKEKATNVFDSTKFISELPDSFGYHIEITDRMSDNMKNNMHLQEEIAKGILDHMDNQHRYY